ncbi:MAG TPA: molybdenum cofactor guanylyltransferase [Pyrinomonadaceae bacterium]|nr:molybdenum cofactor guanylyltransferase [Pyrinomonadaceae bacterium]
MKSKRIIEGFILAGGASSRMGADKAHLRLGGLTLVERAARALNAVASEVRVVSSKPDASAWELPVVADVYERAGALGGLHAALAHARAEWIAVAPCDLPFLTGELFSRLVSHASEEFDAVVPVQEDGRVQPLCALYARRACLDVAARLLDAGERRPRALLGEVRTRLVAFESLADLDGAGLFFKNVNTPDDFEDAARAVDSES